MKAYVVAVKAPTTEMVFHSPLAAEANELKLYRPVNRSGIQNVNEK